MRQSAAIALVTLLAAWLIAQFALDRYLVAQGVHDLARVARGESRSSFEFVRLTELIGANIEGAKDLRIEQGVLRAKLPDGRANVRLNLRGLALDAQRFGQFDARLAVSAPARLIVLFDEPGKLEQLSFEVSLEPGWNTLHWALASLPWTPLNGGAAQSWGGTTGQVGEFRLYVAGPENLDLSLDHVRFASAPGAMTPLQWISAGEARRRLDDEATPGQTGGALGVRLNLRLDLPERSLDLRNRIRARDSEALFWPDGRDLPKLGPARLPEQSGWTTPWAVVVVYALLAAFSRWRWRMPTRRLAAWELLLGFGPLLALSLGLGEQAAAPNLCALGVALAFQLSGIRIAGTRAWGDRTGWAASLRLSLIAALALCGVSLLARHWMPADGERALQYLPFVLLQQALLLGFVWPRAQQITAQHARTLSAALFAAAHAPNFALMVLSMLAAWWWLALFQRHRSWLPILGSHYVLGLLAISCLPPWLMYSAEIGLRYFQLS